MSATRNISYRPRSLFFTPFFCSPSVRTSPEHNIEIKCPLKSALFGKQERGGGGKSCREDYVGGELFWGIDRDQSPRDSMPNKNGSDRLKNAGLGALRRRRDSRSARRSARVLAQRRSRRDTRERCQLRNSSARSDDENKS